MSEADNTRKRLATQRCSTKGLHKAALLDGVHIHASGIGFEQNAQHRNQRAGLRTVKQPRMRCGDSIEYSLKPAGGFQ